MAGKNIVTYAKENLDTFAQFPFCSVDSLILSWLSYMKLPEEYREARGWGEGLRFTELFRAEYFKALFGDTWEPENSVYLLAAMTASPRFRDIRIKGYTEHTDEHTEKQFGAMTFVLPGGGSYVAFRGTDMSFTGWKEDFNMTYQYPVPAQEEALRYLGEAAEHLSGGLYSGGHSKGGNLAVYAAAKAESAVRDRLLKVFSHDGPGFLPKVWESENFRSILPKLEKTIPQSSLVGLLLDHEEELHIVKSNVMVNTVWQHDPFTWIVEDRSFCFLEHLTRKAEYMDRTLDRWLAEMSDEERKDFFGVLFSVLETGGAKSVTDLKADWKKSIPSAVKAMSDMDEQKREFFLKISRQLLSLGVKYLPELFAPSRLPSV